MSMFGPGRSLICYWRYKQEALTWAAVRLCGFFTPLDKSYFLTRLPTPLPSPNHQPALIMPSKPIMQLNKLIKFNKEAQLNVRVAVLERDRSVAAAGFESAAAERGRALLGKILRQETFLRSSLVAEGLDVDAGQEGILGEGGEGCWIDGMPQSWGEEKCVEKHDDEALLERARERCDSMKSDAGDIGQGRGAGGSSSWNCCCGYFHNVSCRTKN